MTAFSPGASPPPVLIAILRMGVSLTMRGRIAAAPRARMFAAPVARKAASPAVVRRGPGLACGVRGLAVHLLHAAPRALLRRHRALQVDLAVVPEQVAGDAHAGRRAPGRAAGEQTRAGAAVPVAEIVEERAAGPLDVALDVAG